MRTGFAGSSARPPTTSANSAALSARRTHPREPPLDLRDPIQTALIAADALAKAGIPHALYGGLLAAVYGEARETTDADFAAAVVPLERARAALESAGMECRANFEGLSLGGVVVDRLSLLGNHGTTGLNCIDLVRPRSARFLAEMLDRARVGPLRGKSISVLTAADFVLLKCHSTRPRDIQDAASALRRSSDLIDRTWLRREAEAIARESGGFDPRPQLEEAIRLADDPRALE